jgi:DNA-binding PadR family transcriptional regulator
MPLAPLNLLILNASMHSPEAPHSISAEIAEFLGRPVSESQVLQAFRELQSLGLVEEHGRGPHQRPNDAWFVATHTGQAAVERDWELVFPSTKGRTVPPALMREHRPSTFARFSIYLLIALWAAAALCNAYRGEVHYPEAFSVALVGLVFFTIAKISAIRKKSISFGSASMSPGMTALYSIGYWLMVVGALVTFG